MNYFSRAFWGAIIFLLPQLLWAEVDPPNYNFSLDRLKVFMPGQKLAKALEIAGNGETVKQSGAFAIHKIYVAHIRYKFPVLVQSKNGEITDFYARLPAYFLHDIFHQSLINRLGNQDVYKKVEEQAVYVWKNKDNLRHVYSGACSITCFPVFYAVYPEKHDFRDFGAYTPVLEIMRKQENWKLAN